MLHEKSSTIPDRFAPALEGFAVRMVRAGLKGKVREIVIRELGRGWKIAPFGDDGTSFEITPRNLRKHVLPVSQAWQKTYRLRGLPGVLYAEPLFSVPLPGDPATDEGREGTVVGEEPLVESNDPDWILKEMTVLKAWQRFFPTPDKIPGNSVVIAHPDTGYRLHPEIRDNLLVEKGRDFVKQDGDAEDELEGNVLLLQFPGHGTATASVMISPRGAEGNYGKDDPSNSAVSGVAPGARIIPLRVSRSVVLWEGSTIKLAHAIEYGADQGAHIISMSLGTAVFSERLLAAVHYAQKRGVIVLAAAGNYVRFVVWPAAFDEVIGVAASNARRKVWRHSSRGGKVDVTAPGESVWCATVEKKDGGVRQSVGRSSGTSFAVAAVAGVAALWLSRHGREQLMEQYGAEKIPFIFNGILRTSCDPIPAAEPNQFGAGLVNAEKVLAAELPDSLEHVVVSPAFGLRQNPSINNGGLETFAHLFELSLSRDDAGRLQRALAELLGTRPAEVASRLKEVGQELAFHLVTNPDLYEKFEAALSDDSERVGSGDLGQVRQRLAAKDISAALQSKIAVPRA